MDLPIFLPSARGLVQIQALAIDYSLYVSCPCLTRYVTHQIVFFLPRLRQVDMLSSTDRSMMPPPHRRFRTTVLNVNGRLEIEALR